MKLKGIELQGFKSFKNKTRLDFKDPITGIVGPNGSGKSNISDAIRWVLGESSAKQMRAERMEEIIFAGTDQVRPLNFSQVSMTFDNSDGWIPLDYDEVVVSRRVFRTGESEYYLNKTRTRRKDIRELFLNTGIGKEGYSIIGQGRIQEILTSKPEERRLIFEEASGIARHKYKKEESMKRLAKTQDNIQRLEDILGEQEKRVAYLEKEAAKARQALDLEEKIKEGTLFYAREDLEGYQQNIRGQQEVIRTMEEDLARAQEEVKGKREGLEDRRQALVQAEQALAHLNQRQQDLALAKQKLEAALELKEENQRFEALRQEERAGDLAYQRKKIQGLEEKQAQLQDRAQAQAASLVRLRDQEAQARAGLVQCQEARRRLQDQEQGQAKHLAQVEEARQQLVIKKTAREQLSLDYQVRQQGWQEQVEALAVKIRDLQAQQKTWQEQEAQVLGALAEEAASLQDQKEDLARQEEALALAQDQVRQVRDRLGALRNRQGFYQKVQESYEGYYQSIKRLFQRVQGTGLEDKIIGTLAELITVEEGFEKVIDTLLYSSLQNIVVASSKEAAQLIEFLKKERIGSCTFLPLANMRRRGPLEVEDPRIIKIAAQAVSCPPQIRGLVEHFLNQTAIVSSIQEARDLSHRYPHRFRIATLDGDLINTSGSMIGGYRGKQRDSGLINRQKDLDQLGQEIRTLDQALAEGQAGVQEAQVRLLRGREAYQKALASREARQEQARNLGQNLALIDQELAHERKKEEEVQAQLAQASQEAFTSQDQLALDQVEVEVRAGCQRAQELARELAQALEEERQKEEAGRQLQMQVEIGQRDGLVLDNQLLELGDELEERRAAEAKLLADQEAFGQRTGELEEQMKETSQALAQLVQEEKDLASAQPQAQERWEELKAKNDQVLQALQELERQELEAGFDLETRRQKLARAYEERQALVDRVREDYGLDLFLVPAMNTSLTKKDLLALRRERQVLGYVSTAAIEDYQVVKEEFDFLQAQKEDLLVSKKDLRQVIQSLDVEMTQTFVQAFEEINKNFEEIFVLLFSGGQAQLVLEEGDVLTAGVEIIARPPGKKRQSLNLLSGGEKALTAVALLFALFKTNPSPFCVLDEIDASLDEANIYRYTNYLKTISHETQFIMITHRKTTMEICDSLFGVSMQEEGISTVLPLAFEDYQEVQ